MAKYQQTVMEQQMKAQMEAAKPKRRGNFASVSNRVDMEDGDIGGAMVVRQNGSAPPTQPSHITNSLSQLSRIDEHPSTGSNTNRKFL